MTFIVETDLGVSLYSVADLRLVGKAMANEKVGWPGWVVMAHAARTAVAAVVSVLVARLVRLPETYWAAITTLVITQSSLGAALKVSGERFFGTALGAAVAAVLATYFAPRAAIYGAALFILGLLCAAVRSDRNAYRFGGVALTMVLLVPRTGPAWQAGLHRFAEVTIGILVALVMTVVWPEKEETAGAKK
jgi:uncharacterized membrane protein YccC